MRPLKIGTVELKERIIAAPLAGISNPAYRQMMHDYGVGLSVSEMISDKALHYKSQKTFDMCRISDGEHPVSLQLFGHDPDTMAEAAEYLTEQTDCDLIDINMGCPVPKVVKNGAGSWLTAHPEEASAVMKAVVSHTDRPVTVKIRAGWDQEHITCVEIAERAQEAGISAIAVHGRTRGQFYQGTCCHDYVKMVKEAVTIPVIGNGDIRTVEDADRMMADTGCDAVMIGRGFLGRPYFATQLKAHFHGETFTEPDWQEKIRLCRAYAVQLCKWEGERNGIRMMRGMAGWYIAGLPYAARYKTRLTQVDTLQQLNDILEEYVKQQTIQND